MKTKKEIVTRYKQAIFYFLSDNCIKGTAIKTFHTIRELYWVLGGIGDCPIQVLPDKKILDKEKLYGVI